MVSKMNCPNCNECVGIEDICHDWKYEGFLYDSDTMYQEFKCTCPHCKMEFRMQGHYTFSHYSVEKMQGVDVDELKDIRLYENEKVWAGIYKLNAGYLECWEWNGCDEGYDYDESVGGVYYLIKDNIDDEEEWDGGIMEYDENSTFEGFIDFVLMAHGVDIIRKIE